MNSQTNHLDSTWHIWRSASFPQISQEKAFLDLGIVGMSFLRVFATGIPPKILVLVADPRHAFTVWWQTLGQRPGWVWLGPSLGLRSQSLRLEPDVSVNFDLKSFISEVAEKAWSDLT